MAKTQNVPQQLTARDLLSQLKGAPSTSKSISVRTTNWVTAKVAKVSGAAASSVDNFGAFYDLAKEDATTANNVALAEYAQQVAGRINERNAKIAALLG